MTVKEVLQLFFLHPVKGLPVLDPKSDRILGFLPKESLVELAAARSDLDLDISGTAERSLLPADSRHLASLFSHIPEDQPIPVIDRQGSVLKTLSRPQLESLLAKPVPPPAPHPSPSLAAAPGDRFRLLDHLPVPVLALNHRQVILHANEAFLESFAMEPEFVIRQQVSNFFPRLRLPAVPEGTFTYGHKHWRYIFRSGFEESFLVFQEAPKPDRPPAESEAAAERILAGKANLKQVTAQFEAKIIRRVYRKHKANLAQAAALLGISEEQLKYRLQRPE